MKKEYASLILYNYRRISEFRIEFTTQSDVLYLVTFLDASDYFGMHPEFSHKVKSFQFEVKRNPHAVLPPDPRVGATISYLILQFFEQNEEGVLFFVHEKSDGKDKSRFRKFESWLRRSGNKTLVKHDAEISVGRTSILLSILLSKDHPQIEEIVGGFDQLVLESSEKPDD
ncbi:MAG: DUF6169 family protein [Bacteroidia bacterium]